MRSVESMRRVASALLFSLILAGAAACGGGGGGNGGGGGSTTPTGGNGNPSPTPTASRQSTRPGQVFTPTPVTTPGTPGTTPTGEPTEPVEIIVPMNGNIRSYARNAPAGATLIISPGTYQAVELRPGDLKGALTLFADTTGEFTDGPNAAVMINAGNKAAAFSIAEQLDVTLDGFTLAGGKQAALLVTDSAGISVFNCTLKNSGGDGARFERSASGFMFNNLILNNAGTGIRVLGTDDMFIVNNTVYNSKNHGMYLGLSMTFPSSNVSATNNIFNKNEPTGITVDTIDPSSLEGYFEDFNLNSDGYGVDTPPGENDVNGTGRLSDPQFVGGPESFRISQTSPAINSGDFETDADLVTFLSERSTQSDGTLDTPPVDLGYHYIVPATPTPRP